MDKYLAFLEKVKEARKKKGLSQEELAKTLGINKIAYNRIENGKTKLTFDRVYQLMDILGTDFVYEFENNSRPLYVVNEDIEALKNELKELEKQLSEKQLLIDLLKEKYTK